MKMKMNKIFVISKQDMKDPAVRAQLYREVAKYILDKAVIGNVCGNQYACNLLSKISMTPKSRVGSNFPEFFRFRPWMSISTSRPWFGYDSDGKNEWMTTAQEANLQRATALLFAEQIAKLEIRDMTPEQIQHIIDE